MGKAARNKKQPFRAVKMTRREMENILEAKIKGTLPEDVKNSPVVGRMVKAAMEDEQGREDLYALSNNILAAAVEWAEDQILEGAITAGALKVTATPALPSTDDDGVVRESAAFSYIWDDEATMWEMVDHSALHLHEVFHDGIVISHRNIPQGETLIPAQLTISFGEMDTEESEFRAAISYGWHLDNLKTVPAAVTLPFSQEESTEPGPLDLMEYFIMEFLSTKLEDEMTLLEAREEVQFLTIQALDAFMPEGKVQDGGFSLLSITMEDEEDDEGEMQSGSVEWHVHGGEPHIVEDSPFNLGRNPFEAMAETYWGMWDYSMMALFAKNVDGVEGNTVMAWHVVPGEIEPMSAQETRDYFSQGDRFEEEDDVTLEYLDAYPIEFKELEWDDEDDEDLE